MRRRIAENGQRRADGRLWGWRATGTGAEGPDGGVIRQGGGNHRLQVIGYRLKEC